MEREHIRLFAHNLDEYSTPEIFKDGYMGKSALIIGSGPSVQNIKKFESRLRNYFDVVIGVNFAILDFENVLDYHLVLEDKPTRVAFLTRITRCRTDLPRILSYKAIRYFPLHLKIIRAKKCGENFNIFEYKTKRSEGFFNGYEEFPIGRSIIFQALHFAGILGCKKVYTIGTELLFRDSKYYYGKDFRKKYRITHKKIERDIKLNRDLYTQVSIDHRGEKCFSIPFYIETAKGINRFIEEVYQKNGIEIYDFSNGLLLDEIQIDLDEFFGPQNGSIEVVI
jgi:hypothetical protein